MMRGACLFPGWARGEVFKVSSLEGKTLPSFQGVDSEIAQLRSAVRATEAQIERIKQAASKKLRAEEAEIFEAHRMMLTDPDYLDGIETEIREHSRPAHEAVHHVTESFAQVLGAASSAYLRERVADLKDVAGRLTRNLLVADEAVPEGKDFIFLGEDLAPSDLIALSEMGLKGVVLSAGGPTSHTSILLKAMGIPSLIMVKDLEDALPNLKNGKNQVFLSSVEGRVAFDLSGAEVEEFDRSLREEEERKTQLVQWKTKKTQLQSGEDLLILANVGSQKQVTEALNEGAEGVGLYRTEFLFLDRPRAPELDEQVEIYRQAKAALGDRPLVIRTLDIGGDKQVSYLNLAKEENPFLGVRGLRLCLERPELLQTQISALLIASEAGPIDVMLPMVTDPFEMRQFFEVIKPLERKQSQVRWGMMLEVPQNLFMIKELSEYVEFFSVGTNDLTQYLTASDRMNPRVQHLNDSASPGVLRAVAMLAREVKACGRDLSVCGEMASDPRLGAFLVGLGVKKLSMSARLITRQRAQLASLSLSDCQTRAEKALQVGSREQVLESLAGPF